MRAYKRTFNLQRLKSQIGSLYLLGFVYLAKTQNYLSSFLAASIVSTTALTIASNPSSSTFSSSGTLNEAVTIDMLYTSSALHPRLKSLIGALSPCNTGPTAVYPPKREAILYPMLPALISGKMKVLACPATVEPAHFTFATSGATAASN